MGRHVWKHGLKRNLGAVLFLAVAVFASPFGLFAQQGEITVSAAASLTNAFKDIGKAFETTHKGSKVYFNFAASGDLLRQIEGGAPVDVFASAAPREMDQLESKGMVMPASRNNFAENSLVLIRPASSSIRIASFDDLKKDDVKRISIGNPASVPAGMYAEQVLRFQKVWDAIKGKLVFGESVRQVLDYVARGEVDAGVVFSTDAKVRAKDVVVVAQAPEGSHTPIVYPIAVVKGAKNQELAKAFVRFVVSAEGQKTLRAYGFKNPSPKK